MKIWRILVYWIAIFLSIVLSSIKYYNFEFSNYVEKIQKLQMAFWDKEIIYVKEWKVFKTKISPLFFKILLLNWKFENNKFCYENFENKDYLLLKEAYKRKHKIKNEKKLDAENIYVYSFSQQISIINLLSNFKLKQKHCVRIYKRKLIKFRSSYYSIIEKKLSSINSKNKNYIRKINDYDFKIFIKYNHMTKVFEYKNQKIKSKLLKNNLLKLYHKNVYSINYTKWVP